MWPRKLSSISLLSVAIAGFIEVSSVSAHGFVREVVIGSETWPGYNPFVDSYVFLFHTTATGMTSMQVVGASSTAHYTENTWNWYAYFPLRLRYNPLKPHIAPIEDLALIELVKGCILLLKYG